MSLLTLVTLLALEGGARWRVEPAAVEVGEPFELVLELEHGRTQAASALAPAELVLDDSWLVLERRAPRSEAAGEGLRTLLAWRIASLEPGERNLAEALAGFAFGEGVTRIQAGEARVVVRGVLAEGEDAPRPLTGFAGELGPAPGAARSRLALGLALAALVAGAGLAAWARARRRRAPRAPQLDSSERLRELAARAAAGAARDGCYDLTRLLREHVDRLRQKPRAALTDPEWLAELAAAPDVPRAALADLERVFARAERVKYAGESPSLWALEELFGEARRALAAWPGAGPATEARP